METALITSSTVVDGKKVHAGQRKVDKPLTIDEAIVFYGSKDALLKHAWKSYVIEVQAQLRNGGDSKTAQAKRLLAKIEAEPDGELAKLAKQVGFTL